MLIAKLAASRSTCNSRPQGAVIVKEKQVLATGYNGACAGQEHCLDKELKCLECGGTGEVDYQYPVPCPTCKGHGKMPYCHRRAAGVDNKDKWFTCVSSHAEANAVAMAARRGIAIEGSSLYCTTSPCYICAKLIHTAGIIHVYYELEYDCLGLQGLYNEKQLTKIELPKDLTCTVTEQLSGITAQRRLAKTV